MRSLALLSFLYISIAYGAILSPRATEAPMCVGLSVKSNNGDRKVAIVIDSSGSMVDTDPQNLRLAAGRALNSWLITKAEATGGKKADLVTVIDFDDVPHLDYPLGDPAGANASFSKIDSSGGTYIAGGVTMGTTQLNASSTGSTSGRSSIIVFTDGEDYDTVSLVKAINQAAGQGIRVSFGFLDSSSSVQASSILTAITASGGVYATITSEDASNNFINFAILNGLTHNDNPTGNNNTLLAGLSISQFITGTDTVSTFYNAQANEMLNFTITSITAGNLTLQAVFGGKVLNSTSTSTYSTLPKKIAVKAPSAGQFEIKVTAQNARAGSVYVLGATSNMPIQNCSIAVTGGGGGGLGTGAKVGLGLGIPALVAVIFLGGFFVMKYLGHKIPPFKNPFAKPPLPPAPPAGPPAGPPVELPVGPTGGEAPLYYGGVEKLGFVETVLPLTTAPLAAVPPTVTSAFPPVVPPPLNPTSPSNAQNPHQKHKRIKRRKHAIGPYHHHHLGYGHPCIEQSQCQLFSPQHVCKDPEAEPKGPCVCTDKECALNKDNHECPDDETIPPCGCEDEECEVTKEVEKKKREKLVLGGVKMAVGEGVKTFVN